MYNLEKEIWQNAISELIQNKIKWKENLLKNISGWDTITSLLWKNIWKDIVDIIYETFKLNYFSIIKQIFKWEYEAWIIDWLEWWNNSWNWWWNSWWMLNLADIFWVDDNGTSESWWENNDNINEILTNKWYKKNLINKISNTLNKYFNSSIFNTNAEESFYFKDEIDEWNRIYENWLITISKHIIIDEIVFLKKTKSKLWVFNLWKKNILVLTAQNMFNNFNYLLDILLNDMPWFWLYTAFFMQFSLFKKDIMKEIKDIYIANNMNFSIKNSYSLTINDEVEQLKKKILKETTKSKNDAMNVWLMIWTVLLWIYKNDFFFKWKGWIIEFINFIIKLSWKEEDKQEWEKIIKYLNEIDKQLYIIESAFNNNWKINSFDYIIKYLYTIIDFMKKNVIVMEYSIKMFGFLLNIFNKDIINFLFIQIPKELPKNKKEKWKKEWEKEWENNSEKEWENSVEKITILE